MKQFLIVGNIVAITYANVFPYIRSGEVKYRPQRVHKFLNGAAAATWYTTLVPPYIEPLKLTKSYNPEDYPKYDNYDAINVDRTINIPYDYDGVMGVPITFLDKYCPEQFEILGIANSARYIGDFPCYTIIDGVKIYNRILIRHRK